VLVKTTEEPTDVIVVIRYHDAVAKLSYRFVHLVEEAFNIPIGTFDHLFVSDDHGNSPKAYLPAQHRIKLLKYPPSNRDMNSQGVGAHKDSSGWLTFLYQVGNENALEVVNGSGDWIPAPPRNGSFVVNFGNAFEAATEGAVRATVHRVKVCRYRLWHRFHPNLMLFSLIGYIVRFADSVLHSFLSGSTT